MNALPQVEPESPLQLLAEAMRRAAGASTDNFGIPAGYTYLGQFVDHDVTFDPDSRRGGRTPALDLDSLYGSGPSSEPSLYGHGSGPHRQARLRVGDNRPLGGKYAAVDLPRDKDGRALIGDGRNDENLIVSQLHLLFIRFHNRVVDHVATRKPGISGTAVFEEARRLVRWHYQWIVVHDFLPKIVDAVTLSAAFRGRSPVSSLPVEFTGAAYRFGHSMIREDYRINDAGRNVPLFHPRGGGDAARHLGGFRRLPAGLQIEWKHFFRTTTETRPQRSKLIDASLAVELSHVPRVNASLAQLDLEQGLEDGLPGGRDAAHDMGLIGLTDEELLAPLPGLADDARALVLRDTPLWYYVLCEAGARARGGAQLGPVGGRIVAEVLFGLLQNDQSSYLVQKPGWTPGELTGSDAFTIADLVKFTR